MDHICLYNQLFNRADLVDPVRIVSANTRKEVEYRRRSSGAWSQHELPSELSILERRPPRRLRRSGKLASWVGWERTEHIGTHRPLKSVRFAVIAVMVA